MNPLERDIYDRLELLVDRLDGLLGDDLLDVADRRLVDDRLASRARQYAAQLVDNDARLAAQTAIDLADLVDLDDPGDAASPLGIAVALTFEHQTVSRTDAAQLLGVGRAQVHALIKAKKLETVRADGGLGQDGDRAEERVLRASIARRLATRRPHTRPADAPTGLALGERQELLGTLGIEDDL